MNSVYGKRLYVALTLIALLIGARPVRASGAPPSLVVSIGDSLRVTGVITVEANPPPIGYPGPIMTDIAPQLFERKSSDGSLRPIRMMLLLMTGPRVAPSGRTAYRVAVTGRYSRLLGADSILVTSITVETELPQPPGSDRVRRAHFQILHTDAGKE